MAGLLIAYAFAWHYGSKLILDADLPPLMWLAARLSEALGGAWLVLTIDEWRWAPDRRYAILRHLDAQGTYVEADRLKAELDLSLVMLLDLNFLKTEGFIEIRVHDLDTLCKIKPAGRKKLENLPAG